jgi:hypothetical protein
MTYEEFVHSKVIWRNTEHFQSLIEAAIQQDVSASLFVKLDKRRVSDLYKKIFDLSTKPKNKSVNYFLYSEYQKLTGDTTKKCTKCLQTLDITEFYSNGYQPVTNNKKYKSQCKKCFDSLKKSRLSNLKLEVFGELTCKICGYNKCEKALEFHHINPEEKEYKISDLKSESEIVIKQELQKCIILCANCHREVHHGLHPEYIISLTS